MPGLIDHLKSHLGSILGGWNCDGDGRNMPFQVVRFRRNVDSGECVLCTLGLSSTPLRHPAAPGRLRQELMMMYRESDGPRSLPGVLQQVGLEAIANDRAHGLGDVLGPGGALCRGATVQALYVTQPVYLPDSFHVFRTGEDPVVIGWLVPITASEAEFVRTRGHSCFEDELERIDPDLLAFDRPEIV